MTNAVYEPGTMEKLQAMEKGKVVTFTAEEMVVVKCFDVSSVIRSKPSSLLGEDGESIQWEAWFEWEYLDRKT